MVARVKNAPNLRNEPTAAIGMHSGGGIGEGNERLVVAEAGGVCQHIQWDSKGHREHHHSEGFGERDDHLVVVMLDARGMIMFLLLLLLLLKSSGGAASGASSCSSAGWGRGGRLECESLRETPAARAPWRETSPGASLRHSSAVGKITAASLQSGEGRGGNSLGLEQCRRIR